MTTDPMNPNAYKRELRHLARKLQTAELAVAESRHELDASLYRWREEGVHVSRLALAAGMSRETAHKSLHRYRAQLPE